MDTYLPIDIYLFSRKTMKKISHNRTYPSSQKNSVANTIFADKREKLKNKIYYTLI